MRRRPVSEQLTDTDRNMPGKPSQNNPDWSAFSSAHGSESPDKPAHNLREAMKAMEQEQWDDYQEYVKRCGGVPISKIDASCPVNPNDGR